MTEAATTSRNVLEEESTKGRHCATTAARLQPEESERRWKPTSSDKACNILCFLKVPVILLHMHSRLTVVYVNLQVLRHKNELILNYSNKKLWYTLPVGSKAFPDSKQLRDSVQQLENRNRPLQNARASRHVGCLIKIKGFLLLSSVEPCVGGQHEHIFLNSNVHSEVEEEIVTANWQRRLPVNNFLL